MLLILSNSQDTTADYLAGILLDRNVSFVRFDTDVSLRASEFRCTRGGPELRLTSEWLRPSDVSHVWYRRPEQLKHDRLDDSPESKYALDEWAEALDGFFAHIPACRWMNFPAANAAASYKVQQLSTASEIGFPVPETLITQDPRRVRDFFEHHRHGIITKPLASGHIGRDEGQQESLIYTTEVTADHLDELDDLTICPTLFQERIAKRSDVRITVVDQDVHAVELTAVGVDGGQRCDIRRNNMDDVTYRRIELPPAVSHNVRTLMRRYELRFGAIDMAICDDDHWVFFEINPNGQWAWLDLAGVTNIAESFVHSFSMRRDTGA